MNIKIFILRLPRIIQLCLLGLHILNQDITPKEETSEEHSAEDLEKAIKYQLQRLEAFQKYQKNCTLDLDQQKCFLWRIFTKFKS